MTQPTVSVLIPTYNRSHYLIEALDSVLAQTLLPSQVIVINDGSTDNTRDVLKPYMNRIELITKDNGGKASALNVGMQQVTGDYVWIFDDDDIALPEGLQSHIEVLECHQHIGFTYAPYWIVLEDARGGFSTPILCSLPDVSASGFFVSLLGTVLYPATRRRRPHELLPPSGPV